MKLRSIFAISILIIIAVSAAGYYGFASSARELPTPQAPQTIAVTKCDVQQTVEAPGKLANTSETHILMPADGNLSQLLVREGDSVSAGQVMAIMDDYAKIRAQAEQAVADAESALQIAQKSFDSMSFPRASDVLINNTQARIDQAKLQVARASDNYRRYSKLPDGHSLKTEAWLSLTNAQINLNNLIAQYNWYTGHYDQVKVDQTRSVLNVAMAQLAAAQAALDSLSEGIEAPFNGVVVEVNITVGQPLHENDVLFTLIDMNALEVKANVTQEDYPLLKSNQSAQVYFDARPDVIAQGKVDRIVPKLVAGDAPTYDIFITLEKIPAGLVDGMTVDTAITIAGRQGVLCLPRSVVHASGDSKASIQVWNGQEAANKQITVGLRGDTNVEILSGLAEGELVVVK